MKSMLSFAILCGLAAAALAPMARAEEGGEGGEGRLRRRPGAADARRRELIRRRVAEEQKRMAEAKQRRNVPPLPFALSEKAREELERHHKTLREMAAGLVEIHKAVKAEIAEGMPPAEAAEIHMEDAKEIAKKMIAERASHLATMSKIVEEEGDAMVDQWAEKLLRAMARKPERRRPPRKDPAPENVDDMNPFEE